MPTPSTPALSFERLVAAIGQAHAELAAQASRAVNAGLTLRNWLIGFHIEEYERRGVDRQQYGEKLLDRLAESLGQKGVSRCDRRELYRYRQFYLTYPQMVEALPPPLSAQLGGAAPGLAGGNRMWSRRLHDLASTARPCSPARRSSPRGSRRTTSSPSAHEVAGIEVKAAATVTTADFRGLRKLKEATGKRFAAGIVLYDGEAGVGFGEGLYAVPIRTLWETT